MSSSDITTTKKATTTTTTTTAPSSSSSTSKTKKTTTTTKNVAESSSRELSDYVWLGLIVYLFYRICMAAYTIRLGAINEYGPVIHEFDPYFNYRATEYLYWNGAERFFKWFDHKVWYPLGRPVGTTIYPGMQFAAVWLKNYVLQDMSLNDICCYIPSWFGVVTTIMTGMLAYECSLPVNTTSNLWQFVYHVVMLISTGKSPYSPSNRVTPEQQQQQQNYRTLLGLSSPATECGLAAMGMMAIVPAHLMRSMGGGYDNESVAVTAMCTTFYFWVRSLRTNDAKAHWFGILTALAYFYMVAAWGGYVFVLNLIGVHAGLLVVMGRFNHQVYMAYTLFYTIGTSLAIQVPVVGWAPLKSLEQLGPAVVFMGYQLLYVTESVVEKKKTSWTRQQTWMFRIKVAGAAAGVIIALIFLLAPTGYFGPISARVRGLFVKHTKTGNPLVDSVAEHQPASGRAYFQYLHHVCSLAPIGYLIVMFRLSNSSSFLLTWGSAAYFFSHKMVRLILLTAPIGSILGGIAAGRLLVWCVHQWWDADEEDTAENSSKTNAVTTIEDDTNTNTNGKIGGKNAAKGKKSKKSAATSTTAAAHNTSSSFEGFMTLQEAASSFSKTKEGIITRRVIACAFLVMGYVAGMAFVTYCWRLQFDLSNPTIIMKGRRRDGTMVTVDDYREAYWWLRDNTPEDSRIMAWWDYGYQISAIANRTTIADGNTWNHEHIALLGKALTTELDEGWEIARHLADYVLIWGGGGGDDLAKSPHLARIANSVYREHCPDDPTCRAFGFIDRQGTPSTMMKRSFLYRLHGHQIKPDVTVPDDKFQEVYRSKFGKVRIFKIIGVSEESKAWVADPNNRVCDVPGSWFCPGQYPPGLKDILARKTDFQQLEDFNKGKRDNTYTEQYFRDLQNPEAARRKILEKEYQEKLREHQKGMSEEEKILEERKKQETYNTWADTEDTTTMWRLINGNDINGLKSWIEADPSKAFVRSKDGRGPMWWAFESRNEEITKMLMKAGVPHTDRDAKGLSPLDLLSAQQR